MSYFIQLPMLRIHFKGHFDKFGMTEFWSRYYRYSAKRTGHLFYEFVAGCPIQIFALNVVWQDNEDISYVAKKVSNLADLIICHFLVKQNLSDLAQIIPFLCINATSIKSKIHNSKFLLIFSKGKQRKICFLHEWGVICFIGTNFCETVHREIYVTWKKYCIKIFIFRFEKIHSVIRIHLTLSSDEYFAKKNLQNWVTQKETEVMSLCYVAHFR